MAQYGYDIKAALITNLTLDYKVATSMNEINASARLREASKEKAEAEKILLVKAPKRKQRQSTYWEQVLPSSVQLS